MRNIKAQKPSVRVHRAMARLSRDRWLSPDEVVQYGRSLARCASPGSIGTVIKYSYAGECEHVGMLRGFPPFFSFEREYIFALQAVKNVRSNKNIAPEIALLSIIKYR